MVIKFIRPSRIVKGTLVFCADECCSWREYSDYDAEIGEEFDLDYDDIDLYGATLGEDYIEIKA